MVEPQFRRRLGERSFYSLHLDRALDWPGALTLPTRYFAAFIGMDASAVGDDDLAHLAEAALDAGAVYVCAWGPDCERVHDVFDEVIVRRELESGSDDTIMTTWHAKESLEDALWFFAQTALPDDAFEDECCAWLAVSVGDEPGADEAWREIGEGHAGRSAHVRLGDTTWRMSSVVVTANNMRVQARRPAGTSTQPVQELEGPRDCRT